MPVTLSLRLSLTLLLVISASSCDSGTTSFGPTPVTSTAIHLVAYDANTHVLEIEFTSHEVYQYFDVPPAIATGLMSAPSKGKYFNAVIRNAGYQFRHVQRQPRSPTNIPRTATLPQVKPHGKRTASPK